ncbi:MAG: GspH/FimT family pseudopilin [Planctomycetaceae bacterium]|nr:GspH/FimT family pseudopilin [Planctomycetaceae bacterium]
MPATKIAGDKSNNDAAVSSAGRAAFSLMDVVAATLIVGILAAVAVPRLQSSMSAYRVESAARRVAADLELARRHARSTGAAETVTFDLTGHRYSFSGVIDPQLPSAVYGTILSDPPYQSRLLKVDFNSSSSVTFDGYGFPSADGSIVLQCGQSVSRIRLNQTTGHVTISEDSS